MSTTQRGYAFVNLGCNSNQADAERLAATFRAKGEEEANSLRSADTLVIMTCAFTHERQEESLKQIQKYHRNQRSNLIISGCLPDINPAALSSFAGLKIIRPRDLDHSAKFTNLPAPHSAGLHRLRVSRGCLGQCTFCAIPRATGPLSSKPIDQVAIEFRQALESGHKKLMLSGEDVGAYGREIGCSLAKLLAKLLESDADFELRIESINPHWLTLLLRESANLSDPRISPHWYVPIQAGSDRLLASMKRPYRVSEFLSSIAKLRRSIPNLHLVTDIIVGHPGEKVDDVLSASDLFCQASIDYVEIMKFDSHEGIRSSTLPGAIAEDEKVFRAAYLILCFVRHLAARHGENVLRTMGLLPINTNVKANRLFDTLSNLPLEAANHAGDCSIRGLLARRLLSTCEDRSKIDKHVGEVCRRIRPPGPVNMPLSNS